MANRTAILSAGQLVTILGLAQTVPGILLIVTIAMAGRVSRMEQQHVTHGLRHNPCVKGNTWPAYPTERTPVLQTGWNWVQFPSRAHTPFVLRA